MTTAMAEIKIPQIEGVTKMKPLEMNEVRFNKKHTVLTPELLKQLDQKANATK